MRVFISYRRADSEESAGRIYDRLAGAFGHEAVFKDVDTIPSPTKFEDFILEWIQSADVVLALIGPEWATIENKGNRRLENEDDPVRLELLAALTSDVPIVPVLVRRAEMPIAEDLPECLHGILDWNALPVRPDPDFNRDMDRLIDRLPQETESGSQALSYRVIANHDDRVRFGIGNETEFQAYVTNVKLVFSNGYSLNARPDELTEDSFGRILLPAHSSAFWAVYVTQLRALSEHVGSDLKPDHLMTSCLLQIDAHRTRKVEQEMKIVDSLKLGEMVSRHLE